MVGNHPSRIVFGSCHSQHYYNNNNSNSYYDHHHNNGITNESTTNHNEKDDSSCVHNNDTTSQKQQPPPPPKQDRSLKTIWDTMSTRNASVMVWVGDAIYGDDFIMISPSPESNNSTTTTTTAVTGTGVTTPTFLHWIPRYVVSSAVWQRLLSSSSSSRWIPRPATPLILQELFHELLNHPGYRRFTRRDHTSRSFNNSTSTTTTTGSTESATTTATTTTTTAGGGMTVLGVWDDHDYGINNGDHRYKYRTENAQWYLQFLQQSSTGSHNPTTEHFYHSQPQPHHHSHYLDLHYMEQRARAGKGLYGVKVLDFHQPYGQELLSDDAAGIEVKEEEEDENDTHHSSSNHKKQLSDRSVAIFLLDCRSHKTPWNPPKFPHRFQLNYDADFLGVEQWQWFERSLRRSTATVNIIVQGLQVHADHFYDGNIVEDWSQFPTAQHRLYQTILSSGVTAPILVSGDVHMAELLRRDCRRRRRRHDQSTESLYSRSRMLLEVTVSGM
jgi:hypothetical protein